MLRTLKAFEYLEPQTTTDALKILSIYGTQARVLAGGTDLLLSMKREEVTPQYIICIKNIRELDYLKYDQEEGLRIGALATHQSIAESPTVKSKFGLLATACSKIGGFQVRTMGTIGGNLCNAGPSQDTVPSLLVLNASLKLISLAGERIVSVEQFFTGPFQTVLKEAELLAEIQIPNPAPRSADCYQWVTKNIAADETLVGVAVLMSLNEEKEICADIGIGLGSVAPTPIRAKQAEGMFRGKRMEDSLIDQAACVAAGETNPRSQAEYRRNVTRVLVKRAIRAVWNSIKERALEVPDVR